MTRVPEAPPGTGETLELKVDNMSFLLEQLGRDCAPDQLVRELTMNAIQANQAAGGARSLVVWDLEPVLSRRFGAPKLAIADTGTGMSGEEMVRYINHLASSGRIQSAEGNFGVGAKIAAATRNPFGMVYLSWKEGRGAMIWFHRHPETGRYGLKLLRRADGTYGYWAEAPEGMKPAIIDRHGTVVVLLGEDESDDTTRSPDGGERGPWLRRYLNSRFFRFPDGVEVRVRESWDGPESRVVRVEGMRRWLERRSEAAGTVDLDDARAHWWILPEREAPGEDAATHLTGGHVGALFQGELYEIYEGRSGTAKLQSFGIAVGHHRVVLYLEPRSRGRQRVVANTARTTLTRGGRALPWGDWAEAFRERLPQQILDLMEEVSGGRDARSRAEAFKERMKSLASLLFIGGSEDSLLRLFAPERPARQREADAGVDREAERDEPLRPTAPDEAELSPQASGERPAADPEQMRIDLDRLLELEVVWMPEEQCGVVDRAGRYIPETNTLLMNRDFRVFADYIARWREKYAGNPAAQREVEDLVKEWLEQPLRELIIRSHFLRGSEGWSEEHIGTLLSDEALTAVSLPCYLTEMRLRSAVAQRLGRLQPLRVAA